MRKINVILFFLVLFSWEGRTQNRMADPLDYLKEIKEDLGIKWPHNRTINLVFHGHSVPAGYFKTPIVNTLDSYPYQVLKLLKEQYPFAVINIINTSIGGENSVSGSERFESEVLIHKPDVLFIDYALNDIGVGLEKSYEAWNKMIKKAMNLKIKIILLTPSPDQRVNILEVDNVLEQYKNQIQLLAKENRVGLVDSYTLFKEKVLAGDSIPKFMSQVNHPNAEGHKLIAEEIITYFQ
ncbi:GDSL-type esterase/lipase family protein [Arenibacter sp. ARW7G5Y1]|uniref:SGNH/GDSL hydrolase family protein n=1 Tax=Arenibacter sp. ARW7G5Y1 TaxID=2135619 RepID=UPI000D75ECAF|nr:GDSL-type esterase/lipase family protein [Arenibacter sp. ARW7G5Y1]PXX31786.1 lysophospholipase L1-like esterase [Arenibacter sp. ARW7G5Y1]